MSAATVAAEPTTNTARHERIERPSDRSVCDGCGVRAYVWVKIKTASLPRDTMELTFCGHHYQQHEAALLPLIIDMMDDRPILASR